MTKKAIIAEMRERSNISNGEAEQQLSTVTSAIAAVVNRERRAVVPGFGIFSRKTRAARTVRNPQNGETINVASRDVTTFREGKS